MKDGYIKLGDLLREFQTKIHVTLDHQAFRKFIQEQLGKFADADLLYIVPREAIKIDVD